MSFTSTRPRLNIAVFPTYIAQNENEESYTYFDLKQQQQKIISGGWEASSQIFKTRKLLYLMHKNPLPIAKK